MKKPNVQPKIAFIAPIYPYRGGIAQYSRALKESLENHSELSTYSFGRLYPSWLYPGKSDKEEGAEGKALPGVRYTIDVYSPLSLRQTARRIVKEGNQVAVITWWTIFWQPGMAYMARYLRRRGVRVVYLCHNIFDHDAQGLKRKVSEKLLSFADGYIVHSSEEADLLSELYPDKPRLNRILPIYTQFPSGDKELPKRGRLELLFFGFIRPYKGLDILLEALAKLQDKEAYLTVAGEPWVDKDKYEQEIRKMNIPNLELHLGYVDDASAANFFQRADVVVLPYRSATGSAVLALAYHYKKPVLASNVGGIPDGVIEGKTGWLIEPADADALAEAIKDITRDDAAQLAAGVDDFCHENTWEKMAVAIRDFLDTVK